MYLLERIPEEKIFLTVRTNSPPPHDCNIVGRFEPGPIPISHYHVYVMKGFNLVEYIVGDCDCTDDTLALEVLEAKKEAEG